MVTPGTPPPPPPPPPPIDTVHRARTSEPVARRPRHRSLTRTGRAGVRLAAARVAAGALVALAAAAGGCGGGERGAPTPLTGVELAGCDSLAPGPVCLLATDGELTLWVPGDTRRLTVTGAQASAREGVQGGERITLRVQRLPATLVLRVEGPAGEDLRQFRLGLAAAAQVEPALARARTLRRARDLDAAIEALADADDRTLAFAYREQWSALERMGEDGRDDALLALERARAAFAAAGRHGEAVDAGTLAVFLLLGESRFAEADAILASLRDASGTGPAGDGDEARAPVDAVAAYLLDYYAGALAGYVGNYRGALAALERAARRASRLGLTTRRRLAEQWLALQLQAVGRREEADGLFVALAQEYGTDGEPCGRAQLDTNIAWNRLLALEAGMAAEDPRPLLRAVLATYASGACTAGETQRANARLNLALAELHAGDVDAATDTLAALDDSALPPVLDTWARELHARIAIARGRAETAVEIYAQLATRAAVQVDPQGEWRAVVGRAQALAALGRRDAALAAFADAERLLQRQSLQVPLHAGRETFIARRTFATQRHVELLLEASRAQEALATARRARTRALTSLRREDRLASLDGTALARWYAALGEYARLRDRLAEEVADDWQRPADALAQARAARERESAAIEARLDAAFALLDASDAGTTPALPARAAGTTLLLYLPLAGGRWAAFAEDDGGVEAALLDCVPDAAAIRAAPQAAALARCLLAPVQTALADAERVVVLPAGAVELVDFHALPWRGGPLAVHVPVAWAVDLADRRGTAALRPDAGEVLVVGDPRGDLPAARREARAVHARFAAARASAPALLLGREASLGELRARLEATELFHYAGHALFDGDGGWSSLLPLADGSAMRVGDILSLRRAPRFVVLAGCETARGDARFASGGVGIAHAFIAAGSEAVLAASRPVDDAVAGTLVDAFYDGWWRGMEPARALSEAQLALAAADPAADWYSFRLMVR